MKYHFDHKVILNTDSEFESLYKWSLQEIDANGKKLGRDLIPWFWSFSFKVNEISLRDTLSFETEHRNGPREKEVVIEDKRSIYAKLTPERRKGQFLYRDTSFSMFGTGRKISQIELHVHKLENANERERSVTWGCVSYTEDLIIQK